MSDDRSDDYLIAPGRVDMEAAEPIPPMAERPNVLQMGTDTRGEPTPPPPPRPVIVPAPAPSKPSGGNE